MRYFLCYFFPCYFDVLFGHGTVFSCHSFELLFPVIVCVILLYNFHCVILSCYLFLSFFHLIYTFFLHFFRVNFLYNFFYNLFLHYLLVISSCIFYVPAMFFLKFFCVSCSFT